MRPNGETQLRNRQLQASGFVLVTVTAHEWNAVPAEQRVAWLAQRCLQAVTAADAAAGEDLLRQAVAA
jgi:hypothetical protein